MTTNPWPAGAATGVGSMPGEDVCEALRVVAGEVPEFAFLPELPARGVGADLTGRTVGLLVDLHAEVQPSGWRFTAAAGRDERRSSSVLRGDLDALDEVLEGYAGPLKLQVCGPWTLAATIELAHGDRAVSDSGACRDVAASLAEGVAEHVSEVSRRCPDATVVLQLDEPALPAVLAGSLPTASGFGRLAAVEPTVVESALRSVLEALPPGTPSLVHCCAPDVPVDLLTRVGVTGLSIDAYLITESQDEAIGTALETGLRFLFGSVPTSGEGAPAGAVRPSVPVDSLAPVRELWRRLGWSPEALGDHAVTPRCGLAGASQEAAVAALRTSRLAAARLVDDPEGVLRGG